MQNFQAPWIPHKRATPFQPQYPSFLHQKALSSTQPSLPHQKPRSSSLKTPRFNTTRSSTPKTPQFYTENPSVPHTPHLLNWGVFGVEQSDFECWKDVVLVWNRCVELRGSVWKLGVLRIFWQFNVFWTHVFAIIIIRIILIWMLNYTVLKYTYFGDKIELRDRTHFGQRLI